MKFEPTYKLVHGPEAERFEHYTNRLAEDFQRLLEGDPEEAELQSFFEQHPCLVPGIRSLGMHPSGFPVHGLLISQPRLPGLREKVPDFMWIASTSAACHPTLIEIERPSKRIFTSKGTPSASFTQARHQLTQWRAWFSQPENVQKFTVEYALVDYRSRIAGIVPRYVLVFGRRSEFEQDAQRSRERSQLLNGEGEGLASYDRIEADPLMANAITVRALGDGRYRVLAVQPTFSLGPIDARRLHYLTDLEDAIRNAPGISDDRKRFLIERLPYWRDWAAGRFEGRGGVIRTGDRE